MRILKNDSEQFKKLENLFEFLNNNEISISSGYQGEIIYKINGFYFKYVVESDVMTESPPSIEGKFVLCNEFGNTEYF